MKYIFTFILFSFCSNLPLIGQLYKIPTFQITEVEGVYCTIDKKWLEPTVQAIQDRLDLHKYGQQLNKTLLYETLEKISSSELSYTIYSPINSSAQARPMIIFVHGGAFVSGSRKSKAVKFLAEEMAKRGFVTASIEYRLSLISTLDLLEAGYLGMQDGNAAIKYFKANANKLGIDTARIFISGISAGGSIALHCGHVDTNDVGLASFNGLDKKYGCYNCTGGIFNYSEKVKGVINIVGGTTEPKILDKNVSTLHIYCDQDSILPANRGIPLYHASALGKGIVKNIISKILPFIKRPEVFGPDYFKNDLKMQSHDYIEISSLMNTTCSHSLIVGDNGVPRNSGIRILEEIFVWTKKHLGPTINNSFSTPFKIKTWNRYNVLSNPKDKIEKVSISNKEIEYEVLDNYSVAFYADKPGNYEVKIAAINDLGLEAEQTFRINAESKVIDQHKYNVDKKKNNIVVFVLMVALILIIILIKYKNK